MYTSLLHNPDDIIEAAKEDLQKYVDSIPKHRPIHQYFSYSKKEIKHHDDVGAFQRTKKISRFIEKHLDWLEMKYPDHKVGTYQQQFMEILEGWLLRFTQSKIKRLRTVLRAPYIFEFADFIVKLNLGRQYSLKFLTKKQSGFDLKGFPSFLVISSGASAAYVVFDEEKINCKNKNLCERRYEMCLLHEVGHVRLHGDWIVSTQKATGQGQVSALPAFETDAWLYAYTVLGYLGGLRSRISRLLREEDNEGILAL